MKTVSVTSPRILTPPEEARLLKACRERYRVEGVTRAGEGYVRPYRRTDTTWSQVYDPPPWLHPLAFLGLWTALRKTDLLRLRWPDVEAEAIRIPAAGRKPRRAVEIPLLPEAVALLRDLRGRRNDQAGPVLAGMPVFHACVHQVFGHAVRRAGFPRSVTFETLRYTGASRLFAAGVELRQVLAIGWSDPAALLRVYARGLEEPAAHAGAVEPARAEALVIAGGIHGP
jgi:integrase